MRSIQSYESKSKTATGFSARTPAPVRKSIFRAHIRYIQSYESKSKNRDGLFGANTSTRAEIHISGTHPHVTRT